MANNQSRPLPPLKADHIQKFWNKVAVTDPSKCWIWTASGYANGYGKMNLTFGSTAITTGAHRISYTIHNGQIPEGLLVLHHCDVRECVNPSHLFLGTPLDNCTDKLAKGRGNHGYKNGQTIQSICENDVYLMREMYASGLFTVPFISKLFGFKNASAQNAINGGTWRHIPMPHGPHGQFAHRRYEKANTARQ